MKCPALTFVAYPSLDAQVKYLKCHTDLFILKCHVYYFYLSWCKTLKKIFWRSNHQDFSYQGIGVVFPTTQKFAHLLHLEKFSSTENSFLVYYNFTLFVNPIHANFDFNVMFNIYRMLLLPLKKLAENAPPPTPSWHFKNPGHIFCYLFLCVVNAEFVMVHSILKLRENLEQKGLEKF